ncbi:MAG: T9SS type A sorting domain-containing protein, partial [bacterium]|nr:T9SS type A sorting domain-containing protein [bacterium]
FKAVSAYGNNLYLDNICKVNGTTGISNLNLEIPDKYSLSQNYPNPFNPTTKINFSVPVNSLVKLKIYDVLGKEVMTLINEQKQAGNYAAEFNGANLSSGIYFFRMEAGEFVDVKRMVLVK